MGIIAYNSKKVRRSQKYIVGGEEHSVYTTCEPFIYFIVVLGIILFTAYQPRQKLTIIL